MQGRFSSVSDKLKKVERQIGTLKEHINHSENFKEHRALKQQYDKFCAEYETAKKATGLLAERKADKAFAAANKFYEDNRAGLTLYDAAEKYLRGVLQKHYDLKKLPPLRKWQDELTTKTTEKAALYSECYSLRNETENAEKIKKSVSELMREELPEQTRKSKDMVL